MRMRRSRMQQFGVANRIVKKDKEGVPKVTYSAPFLVAGEYWPASGKVQSEAYGDRLKYIMNAKVKGTYTVESEGSAQRYMFDKFSVQENDGVCIYRDDEPDYKIISIKPYKPLRMEVERLCV